MKSEDGSKSERDTGNDIPRVMKIKQYQIDPFDVDTTFSYDVREVLDLSLEDAIHLRGLLVQASLQLNEYISLKKRDTEFSLTEDF